MKPIPILRHVPHEPAGTIEDALATAGLEFQYIDLFREAPADFTTDGPPGLIVMGGPMNVDETAQYPFLAQEIGWIRDAVRRQVPVLGVCLGSQLLAKALGARVYPMGGGSTLKRELQPGSTLKRELQRVVPIKEIGWFQIELTPEAASDPLFGYRCEGGNRDWGQQPPKLTVFQWHGDTFDLPERAVCLARSEVCPHQVFRYGDSAWGLQFHIEMTAAMVDDWLGEPGNCGELAELPYVDLEAIRAQTARELPKLQAVAQDVLGRFAAICRQRA
jgi:GMP synthase (glutamine-hydrolysing)